MPWLQYYGKKDFCKGFFRNIVEEKRVCYTDNVSGLLVGKGKFTKRVVLKMNILPFIFLVVQGIHKIVGGTQWR